MKNKFLNLAIIFGSIFAMTSCGAAGVYDDYANNIQGHVLTTLVPEDNPETEEDESRLLLDNTNDYSFKFTEYDKEIELPIYTEDGIFERTEKSKAKVETIVKGKIGDGFQIIEQAYRKGATSPIKTEDIRLDVRELSKKEKEDLYKPESMFTPEIALENLDKVFKTDSYMYVPESKKFAHHPVESYTVFEKSETEINYRDIAADDTSMYAEYLRSFDGGFLTLSTLLNVYSDVNHLHDAGSESLPIFIEPCVIGAWDGSVRYLTKFENIDDNCQVSLEYTSFKDWSDLFGNIFTKNMLFIEKTEIRSTTNNKLLFGLDVDTSLTKRISITTPDKADIIEATLPEETK